MNFMYRFTAFIINIYIYITCRLHVGKELDKIPMKGPLIVVSNHTGQIEVPMVFALLQPRKITGWAKVETWDNWFLNWVFNLWGMIPIRRGEADISALRKAEAALANGMIFGIAPEGTRNKTGRLLRAYPGAVLLAVRTGVPILPMAHWGGEVYLKNLKRLKRTDFHIRVGKPFKLELEGVKMTREVRQQIADEMMLRIAELMPPEYRGEYEKVTPPEKPFTKVVEWS
jgi:1-acyl-sn-glycerol-3-phosphate acyltransferase